MFNSKFLMFIVGILVLCLILVGCIFVSDALYDSDYTLDESSADVAYIWTEDDNGNMKFSPTTNTYIEGFTPS